MRAAVELASAPGRIEGMRQAARKMASAASWDRVFELTYAAYSACLAGRDESWEGDKSPSRWLVMKGLEWHRQALPDALSSPEIPRRGKEHRLRQTFPGSLLCSGRGFRRTAPR